MLNNVDMLSVNLNNKIASYVIYFHFAKVFDSVSHIIILQKLKLMYMVLMASLLTFYQVMQNERLSLKPLNFEV